MNLSSISQYLSKNWLTGLMYLVVIIGLYLSSLYSYLLFHVFAELYSIIIACGLFMIAWNTKELTDDDYLVYLSIAYLFIGILDLFHTLGYKGMKIFIDYNFYANQLWIGARMMESLTLLWFCTFAGRKRALSFTAVLMIYAFLTLLILASVFVWKIFPVCFIEGQGQTRFKIISEYVIIAILGASGAALHTNRHVFDPFIQQLLMGSIVLTIASESMFTLYISNYGLSNMLGHYFKIASFYLVYKSIIESGLKNPFNLIFKKLKDSETQYKNLFNTSLVGILRITPDGSKVLAANSSAAAIFGYDSSEAFITEFIPIHSHVHPNRREDFIRKIEADGKAEGIEFVLKNKNSAHRHLTLNAVRYPEYIEEVVLDITEQVEARKKMQEAMEQEALQRGKLEMASSVLHDIGNAITNIGTTVSRLLGEPDWPEVLMLQKLEQMAEQKKEAFTAALGPGKGEALIGFIQELRKSLKEHSSSLRTDFQKMAKTISHVNDILQLQRQYARDGSTGQQVSIDLSKLIDDALAMHAGGLEKRQIQVIPSIPAAIPKICGDRTKLMRVLLNLLKNACESFDRSSHKTDRRLQISAERMPEERIRITLSDNAAGFEPELSERLFQAGFSTKGKDSGLGLPRCKDIIESHGGRIWIESQGPGMGARAMIELPISYQEAQDETTI